MLSVTLQIGTIMTRKGKTKNNWRCSKNTNPVKTSTDSNAEKRNSKVNEGISAISTLEYKKWAFSFLMHCMNETGSFSPPKIRIYEPVSFYKVVYFESL